MANGLYKCAVILIAIAGTAGVGGAPALAQAVDNAGTEFYIGFMPNWDDLAGMTTELHLTSEVPTNVTVHYPAIEPVFVDTLAIGPGEVTIVDLGIDPAFAWPPGEVADNAVHAFSEDEFVVFAINRRHESTDVALALPVDALGMEYIVQTYTPFHRFGVFAVVAAYDGTIVTMTPARELVGGYVEGVPFTVTLNRGEGFLGQSEVQQGPDGDLTGTLIQANRPVQVSNGNGCTLVPQFRQSCDHLFEIAQPVQVWGHEAIAAPVPERPAGSVYRVLASQDSTTVQQNGMTLATLGRGEFHEVVDVAEAQVFSADKPILVTQFITGNSSPDAELFSGDPSMGTVLPPEQYLRQYTFSTVGGEQFGRNYVSIIAENADVTAGTLALDGTPVAAAEFTPIDGTDYSYAVLSIAEGTHTTASDSPHGLNVMGYDDFDSYLFPAGATFANSLATSAESEISPKFGLAQNYPNPLRSSTWIPFSLDEAIPVRLTIYDLLGREVVTLVQAVLSAGAHTFEWQGRDAAGRSVSSGMYWYRVEAGGLSTARRMTLVR